MTEFYEKKERKEIIKMTIDGKINKITDLFNKCDELIDTISSIEIFNLNFDETAKESECISNDSPTWRSLKSQILSLDKIIGAYPKIKEIQKLIENNMSANKSSIIEIKALLEELKTEIETEYYSNDSTVTKDISNLERLLNEMDNLKNEFQRGQSIPGMSNSNKIYKNHKFLLWKSRLSNELNGNTNPLASKIINDLDIFDGRKDEELFNSINANLKVLVENEKLGGKSLKKEIKKKAKIFISHSSKDESYVKKIVEFLEDINIQEEDLFCSSIPGCGIPHGKNIYDYLREQFDSFDLHVIFILSSNYYNSCACMNEMGAAWICRNEHTTMLLPGFEFSGIKGVLDPNEVAIKFDVQSGTVKQHLIEFRNKMLELFNLPSISETKWERIRDNLIKDINNI